MESGSFAHVEIAVKRWRQTSKTDLETEKDVTALMLEKEYYYTADMIKNTFEWARANGKAYHHPINKEEYCTVSVEKLRQWKNESGQGETHEAHGALEDMLLRWANMYMHTCMRVTATCKCIPFHGPCIDMHACINVFKHLFHVMHFALCMHACMIKHVNAWHGHEGHNIRDDMNDIFCFCMLSFCQDKTGSICDALTDVPSLGGGFSEDSSPTVPLPQAPMNLNKLLVILNSHRNLF